MAVLKIINHPNKILYTPCLEVKSLTAELHSLIDDMLETMYAAKGIGLAANQVGSTQKVMIVDVSKNCDQPLCFINPEIIAKQGEVLREEGCLSFPGIHIKIKRAEQVTVKYLDLNFEQKLLTADDLLGHCIQHEIDHLNGITFIQHLKTAKRQLIANQLNKLVANSELE